MLFDDVSNIDLAECYMLWKQENEERFIQLKSNEEELNRIFIDIYGLQDELTSVVEEKDITVHRIYDTKNDVPESMQGSPYVRTMRDEITSLLSYIVGCMFGRYSLDVEGTEAVLLEPSNGSNYQACAALTSLPDPVWAYIHFKVKIVEEKGSITVRKVDATGAPLAGAELLLETSTDGQTWTAVGRITTDRTGVAKWENLKIGAQYCVTETKAPAGYTLLTEPLFTGTLDNNNRDITITACNNAGFALPFTGGTGFTTYFLFAALALMAGVYFCKKSDFMKETTE